MPRLLRRLGNGRPSAATGMLRCRESYDVDLYVTTFEGDHYENMWAMQTTDILLGMHGAGLAHAMFLPPVR